jgi:hypothetical protein
MAIQQTKNAIAPRAPAAGQAGYGRGNIPFAPGMQSGRTLGQQGPPPLARQSPQSGRTLNAGPPPGPSGPLSGMQQGGPPGGPPGGQPPPGGPPMGMPTINPVTYVNVLDWLMEALMESTQNGGSVLDNIY